MKIVASIPASRAAQATAWPWLPALAATTPALRSVSLREPILLTAPRILNEPVRCSVSAFSCTGRPVMRPKVSEAYRGVTRTPLPARRSRAASTSASVGAVSVAKFEHLVHDLLHRCQGVQFSLLHLVEEPPQLGIAFHRALEMRLRARRRDREHLTREVPPTAFLERSALLEMGAVLLDLLPELRHAVVRRRLGEHDRRPPGPVLVERED